MTQVVTSAPLSASAPAVSIRETEFWIAANVRPEYPAGGIVARIDFPISLQLDSTITVAGTNFRVNSSGVIIAADRAVMVYGLR